MLAWGGDGTGAAAPGTATTQQATTTTWRPTTIMRLPTTTKVAPGHVPGKVVASAGAGGGSGEVQVEWKAAVRATGYRVYLTDSAGRIARLMVDINIVTGQTRAEPEVVYLISEEHVYVPDGGPLTGADGSSWFQYIDYMDGNIRCYRLQAYNAAGAGPLSAVTCGGHGLRPTTDHP